MADARDLAVGDGADLAFAEDLDHVAEVLARHRVLHGARRVIDRVALADLERLLLLEWTYASSRVPSMSFSSLEPTILPARASSPGSTKPVCRKKTLSGSLPRPTMRGRGSVDAPRRRRGRPPPGGAGA